MIDLREYRQSAAGLEDYVPWCVMIEDGIILNHDGSLQQSFRYRGPDMDSSTEDELVAAVVSNYPETGEDYARTCVREFVEQLRAADCLA